MIYLLDDKKSRQNDYGWNENKFQLYSDSIKPIYLYDEIKEISSKKILSSNNIVLFHESFFDIVDNDHKDKGVEIRSNLIKMAQEDNQFMLSFFSGSKDSRKLVQNIGYLPVSILYQNLEIFIQKSTQNNSDFRYLIFGDNYNIESELLEKLNEANNSFELDIKKALKNNFIAKTLENEIDEVFENATEKTFFLEEKYDNLISDGYLNDKIYEWFSEVKYDNIFIPLCFGDTLSDYTGLRFATQIRCTNTINRLSNIFIYGFVGYNYIFKNKYFDVLRTKNVSLIGYKKENFYSSENKEPESFELNELANEISKLSLKPPKNYDDNHSISNEWGIYRWANTINATDDEIEKIVNKVESQLYFNYLRTIYQVAGVSKLNEDKLKISYTGTPKILYIDDEAEKGWFDVFCKILVDENNIDFWHLDDEFNEKTKNEIIDISINKVINEDFDIVILDLRLHKQDFGNKIIQDITGYKILKKIKEFNKGIQVIIFSATNKIWNLQELQKAGADGFILKGSLDNSFNSEFTKNSILNMVENLDLCLSMRFLKDAHRIIDEIRSHIITISNDCEEKQFEKLLKMKFKNEIFIQFDLIYDCLKKSSEDISTEIKDENSYLNLSFISIYKIVELINDYYTDVKGRELKSNFKTIQKYNQNSNTFSKITRDYPTTRDKIYSIIKFELNADPSEYVNKLNKFINFRNNIIHPKTLKDYKKTTQKDNLEFLELLKSLIVAIK